MNRKILLNHPFFDEGLANDTYGKYREVPSSKLAQLGATEELNPHQNDLHGGTSKIA